MIPLDDATNVAITMCPGSHTPVEGWLEAIWEGGNTAPCPECGQAVELDWSGTDAETTSVIFEAHEKGEDHG